METVRVEHQAAIYIDFDVAGLSGGKSVLVGQLLQQRLQLNGFAFELEGFAAFHTHREDLLDHSFQLLQLALADFQVFAAFLRIIARIEVEQGVIGGVGHGHRGLELMGDVVGEVALHFFQALLLEHGMDQEPEGECEDKE